MKDALLKNIRTLAKTTKLVYASNDYTSATILYFKLYFSVLDYLILTKKGFMPEDHSDRFQILKEEIPEEYLFLDQHFKIYRDTYSFTIEKFKCDLVKKHVEETIEQNKIPI